MNKILDLHGQTEKIAEVELINFVEGHASIGTWKIEVIFGLGTGVLKKMVHKNLTQLKRKGTVKKFEHPSFPRYNLGSYYIYFKQPY